MNYLKTVCLVVLVAMALMAFVAGSASATKLCTDSACKTVYPAGTEIKSELASGSSAALTSGGSTIATCTSAGLSGKTNNKEGATVSSTISSLTWGGCSQTTHTVANGSFEIEYTSGTNGRLIGKGTQITFQIFGVSCTYGTGEGTELGTFVGGETPHHTITADIPKKAGGFLCPSSSTIHLTLLVTAPDGTYVAK